MSTCISGWVMLNRRAAVIEDVYADARIPAEAYRPTFVKSLAMVPIRTRDPVGAIGNYWAATNRPSPEQVKILQTLADTTAVALENVQVYAELNQKIRDMAALMQAAPVAIVSFDPECKPLSWNSAAEQLFNMDPGRMDPGRALGGQLAGIDPDSARDFQALLEAVRVGNVVSGQALKGGRADNAPIDLRLSGSPAQKDDGTD